MTWVSTSRRLGILALALAFGLALGACGKKEEGGEKAMEKAAPAEGAVQEQTPPAEGVTKEENYPSEEGMKKEAAPPEAAPSEAAPSEGTGEKSGDMKKDTGEQPQAPENGNTSPSEDQ